jgi:hypothetical protein
MIVALICSMSPSIFLVSRVGAARTNSVRMHRRSWPDRITDGGLKDDAATQDNSC